ncbi:DNA-binding transcription factor [Lithospermum erythrorhizon]|uniref:DNA-binding transcription factor n=1 Tax=Lithospermum erythrorhizon TaxID=34254 RepID=A0AAV3PMD7_LITER
MEGGVPILNCLLQQSLRSLCTCTNSSNSSKWIYAVYWRVLPRNYPPPKWDHEGGMINRVKGNKRNWILVWEDGFCDFYACEQASSGYVEGRFGADIFFKLSHEVYSFGEGLVGKIAADNSHKWVFRDGPSEKDSNFISSWNVSLEPQPRAWEAQFKSGIQTIALIAVREGIIQLGSLDKVPEDLDLVISIQRKFSYLQSVPSSIKTIQRQYSPIQNLHSFKTNDPHHLMEAKKSANGINGSTKLAGSKRLFGESESPEKFLNKSISYGHNSSQPCVFGPPPHLWSIPPLLPSVSYSLGAYSTNIPFVSSSDQTLDSILLINQSNNLKNAGENRKVDETTLKELDNLDVKSEAERWD